MPAKRDLTGRCFGRLIVIEETQERRNNSVVWKCKCVCGNDCKVSSSNMIEGKTTSCGCYGDETRSKNGLKNVTHGKSKTEMYWLWVGIKDRCYNINDAAYQAYGGRGIRMSDEWLNSIDAFVHDMGIRPSKNHSIDRVDNNLGYCKDNCRWANAAQQSRNRKKFRNNTSGVTGVFLIEDKRWCACVYDPDTHKTIRKYFPIKVYGDRAKELAISARNEMIALVNTKGAGYTEGHGT